MAQSAPLPELLAPAGDAESFKAAIAAGADAIFFGLPAFSARSRAKNISLKEMPDLLELAHRHGVRTYLTMNTLLLDHEIHPAVNLLKKCFEMGLSAVIIQDWGLLRILKENLSPDAIHSSTQMTTHNEGQIHFLSRHGIGQINLSRELSLEEAHSLCKTCHSHHIVPEIFVHGALCTSFSGQCYFSMSLYGHAGNRGDCVQPCRRQYTRTENSQGLRPFNLRDNSLFAHGAKLLEIGAGSVKIEGRIKDASYVWTIVSAWREHLRNIGVGDTSEGDDPRLHRVFNRTFTDAYARGAISPEMFSPHDGSAAQQEGGTVCAYHADTKTLHLSTGILPKGALCTLFTTKGEFVCTGIINNVHRNNTYTFTITNKLVRKIQRTQNVFFTPPDISAHTRKQKITEIEQKKRRVTVHLSGEYGNPLRCRFVIDSSNEFCVSKRTLERAQNRALTRKTLKHHLDTLHSSGISVVIGEMNLPEHPFLPVGDLKQIRNTIRDSVQRTYRRKSPSIPIPPLPPVRKNHRARLAYITDSPQEATRLAKQKKLVFCDVPRRISEKITAFFQSSPRVLPIFPAILIGHDYTAACVFLEKIPQKRIFCENTGIALAASMLGKEVILGSRANITNSYGIELFSHSLSLCGVVPSREISPHDVSSLRPPPGIPLWHPLLTRDFLLESRACLAARSRSCLHPCTSPQNAGCTISHVLHGIEGEKIRIEKTPEEYSCLYGEKALSYTSYIELLNTISVFTVDLRVYPPGTKRETCLTQAEAFIQKPTPSFTFSQSCRPSHFCTKNTETSVQDVFCPKRN
ncbi:peptidase U32 family protein [Chitinivibrio alkaliphilus]|uniref:U32 family peptidase n=1 Tax=Chitinivibrio alkaliphilus ACht1 TaxID=1313304 RepID=U7D8N2_9BACT|nr:DUF3656 domain-containing protein [Chitinivibrio alkaliphilus]ERP39280.1 U32 family peptidase [Chitinivibrio alkaliphilus ACht1]